VRSKDEYEPDPSDVQHMGSDHVHIQFNDTFWFVDDFISLLLDVDRVVEKRNFMEFYHSPEYDPLDDNSTELYHHFTTHVAENEFTVAVLDDPVLGDETNRYFLKRYLFWFSIFLDTRAERLACKMNNVLVNLGLGAPYEVKVGNVRRALKNILLQYALGYCSADVFESTLCSAYEYGFCIIQEPDLPAENPDPQCLFDVSATKFAEHEGPWLTIRFAREDPMIVVSAGDDSEPPDDMEQ
jgi:hypothetical protein